MSRDMKGIPDHPNSSVLSRLFLHVSKEHFALEAWVALGMIILSAMPYLCHLSIRVVRPAHCLCYNPKAIVIRIDLDSSESFILCRNYWCGIRRFQDRQGINLNLQPSDSLI